MAKKELSQAAKVLQVAARQEFLEKVAEFVGVLMHERGKVVYHYVHNNHTENKIELDGFEGFSFFTHGSLTMFGGEKLKIWYTPKEGQKTPVLEMSWQDIEKCNVTLFEPSMEWQRKLKLLMRNKDAAIARDERKRKLMVQRAERKAALERRSQEIARSLAEDQKRLALVA